MKFIAIIIIIFFVIQWLDYSHNLRSGLEEIQAIIQRNDPLQLTQMKREPQTRSQLVIVRIWQVVEETLKKANCQ